ERAYYDARNQLGEVVSVSDRVQTQALRALAFQINIPLDDTKLPVVVFNPHSWPIEAPVEVETGSFANIPVQGALMVQDHVGRRVPCQKIDSSCKLNGRNRITFRAKVPALGYATYFLMAETVEDPFVAPLEDLVLENEYLRVEFDPATGGIASIFDRRSEQQILAAPTAATVIDDRDSDTWGHTLVRLDKREGNFTATQFKVMDHGPVRTCLKVRSSYGDSTLTQVYSLYAGEAQIHVDTTVNWQEKRRALKLEFPVNVEAGQACVEIPYGHLNKNMDGKEEPMQQWADISGTTPAGDCACCSGRIGLSVINDSKYSVDFHDNTIALTALRSPVYAHHDPYELREDEDYSYIDQGIQRFSYTLIPHGGDWHKAGTIQAAALLNQPLTTTFETFHGGALPQRGGFFAVDSDNIIMTALKKSYRGEDIILRMYESAGVETTASIGLLTYSFKAHFKPYEIKTFRIRPDKSVREVNLLEE
ncbi:MAG: alpha-mannosidase, partial [Clostridia bacterium]|nr:alpha-mannosidase [Clostridia bacterium]